MAVEKGEGRVRKTVGYGTVTYSKSVLKHHIQNCKNIRTI